MDEIDEYIKLGLAGQIFEAEISLVVWDKIAGQVDKYDKQDNTTKKLFSYIQRSSGTNYILSTAKIFDTPKNKYPTKCLQSFFNLVDKKSDFPNIVNEGSLISMLKAFNCSETLISKVSGSNPKEFAKEFCSYYRHKYNSAEIQNAIEEIKFSRDKFIAHNEAIKTNGRVEIKTVRTLLDFATEVVSVFSFAFFNSRWTIKVHAEDNAYFIEWALGKLLKN